MYEISKKFITRKQLQCTTEDLQKLSQESIVNLVPEDNLYLEHNFTTELKRARIMLKKYQVFLSRQE